jgi:predicted DNA-binding protein
MAGRYRNPSYRQYLPQELLDELRAVSKATRRPMQQIVRVAVRRFLSELRAPGEHRG